MRSDASTVEAYVAEAPAERRTALELLRRLCLEELTGFDETIRYGMPGYVRAGAVEVGFASQARHISLYLLRQGALEAVAGRLAGLSVGKGCVRFTRPEQIDPELVRDLLRATVVDTGALC